MRSRRWGRLWPTSKCQSRSASWFWKQTRLASTDASYAGTTTQQFRELPGRIQRSLPPNHFPGSVPWLLTPAVLVIYSPGSSRNLEVPPGAKKTGSISPHLAKGPGRNTCTLTGQRSKFPLCQQCFPSPGPSCDIGAQLNVFPSKEEMTHYRKASLRPPAHPLKWRRCWTFTKNINTV